MGQHNFRITTKQNFIIFQYIRLSHTTKYEDIYQLFREGWGLPYPNMVVSVHGGKDNFGIQKNLSKGLKRGLLNAGKNQNAWIITSGASTGKYP